jgi:hypothetical protein
VCTTHFHSFIHSFIHSHNCKRAFTERFFPVTVNVERARDNTLARPREKLASPVVVVPPHHKHDDDHDDQILACLLIALWRKAVACLRLSRSSGSGDFKGARAGRPPGPTRLPQENVAAGILEAVGCPGFGAAAAAGIEATTAGPFALRCTTISSSGSRTAPSPNRNCERAATREWKAQDVHRFATGSIFDLSAM